MRELKKDQVSTVCIQKRTLLFCPNPKLIIFSLRDSLAKNFFSDNSLCTKIACYFERHNVNFTSIINHNVKLSMPLHI